MEQNLQKISLKIRKIILILFGVTIMGLGTGICNSTGLGIDPVNALGMGIAKQKKFTFRISYFCDSTNHNYSSASIRQEFY